MNEQLVAILDLILTIETSSSDLEVAFDVDGTQRLVLDQLLMTAHPEFDLNKIDAMVVHYRNNGDRLAAINSVTSA